MGENNTNSVIEPRRRINREQKAWKYIRDVNGISLNNLSSIAIYDGVKEYTYGQMFREWERYASVFSALGINSINKSKAGILGSTSAEVLFSIYGLNMTGAAVSVVPSYSALFPHKILDTVRNEELTDFIITDDFAQANLINELVFRRIELGLRNIIILHVSVSGVTVEPLLTAAQEMKYMQIKSYYCPICMDELLSAYGNGPISYALEENDESAFVLHTSGTTSGAGTPVTLSDKAFNTAVASFYEMDNLDLPYDELVTAAIVDLSNAYGLVDQVHLPFAMGAAVVMVPGGVLNPWFYKAISQYNISFLFSISAMFERWMKMTDHKDFDFSSLRFVAIGGSAVSAADKKRFYRFMQDHGGGDITLLNGYGISELCGACCLSSPDLEDESIGYPLPGVVIRLYDDKSGEFLPEGKKPAEGVMYLNAPFVATTRIDGKEILKAEYIEERPFICTNDLVRVEEDGRVQFLGRANRYFINDEGRKYESGRVETEIARQEGIENCCVVPVYVKTIHDNMPMLCIQTIKEKEEPEELVLKALRQIFLLEKTLPMDHLPFRVMIMDMLPRNANGKIDTYKLGRGEVEGEIYNVETVKRLKQVTDFKLKPYKEGPADMIKEVFDGIAHEMKSSLPFNENKDKERRNNSNMDNKNFAKQAFDGFNSMNKMGMQMMNNMMGKMGNAQGCMPPFPNMMPNCKNMMPNCQDMMSNFQDMMSNFQNMMSNLQNMMPNGQNMMPNCQDMMSNFQKMMPNGQNMMPNFQDMMPNFQDMMPNFQNMMPNCQNMMPNFQNMMPNFPNMMPGFKGPMPCFQNQAKNMGPMMQEQMGHMMEYMKKMNQISLEAMQKMMEENYKMMAQFYASMQQMTSAMAAGMSPEKAAAKEEEKPEEAAAKGEAKAEEAAAKDEAKPEEAAAKEEAKAEEEAAKEEVEPEEAAAKEEAEPEEPAAKEEKPEEKPEETAEAEKEKEPAIEAQQPQEAKSESAPDKEITVKKATRRTTRKKTVSKPKKEKEEKAEE